MVHTIPAFFGTLDNYVKWTFAFHKGVTLFCVSPHLLGDPICWFYLPSQGMHISGCQPPWGHCVFQLGAFLAESRKKGTSLSHETSLCCHSGSHCNRDSLLAVGLLTPHSPCLPKECLGAAQLPLSCTQVGLLGQPELQPPPAQMVLAAPQGGRDQSHACRKEQSPRASPCCGQRCLQRLPHSGKCSRQWLSDLASLTLQWWGYGAVTWPCQWQRGLKSAPNCFPEGVYFLPADRHEQLYKYSLHLWG